MFFSLLIYNLLWLIILFLSFPYYIYLLFKKKHSLLFHRFGLINFPEKEFIWIRAASVGEVKIALKFIEEIRKISYEPIVISVQTETGFLVANKNLPVNTYCCFAPFDFFPIFFFLQNRIRIKKMILIETELWPSCMASCFLGQIPTYIINGRISDKSYPKYKKVKALYKKFLKKMIIVNVQNNEYKKRFIELGCDNRTIRVLPNMKYDLINIEKAEQKALFFKGKKVLTAGSIRRPEEQYIIEVYKELKKDFSDLICIIAPRHLENVPLIENELNKEGIPYSKYSNLSEIVNSVVIVDVMGALVELYKSSDVVFVGGSLVDKGGQNIIEPLSLGKPVIFGPYMDNFKEESKIALTSNSALQVANKELLKNKIKEILLYPEKAKYLSQNAFALLKNQQGTIKKIVEMII